MLLLLGVMSFASTALGHPCSNVGAAIVVHVSERRLWLCDQGGASKEFAVALGKGGVGKVTEGDQKTPLGDYWLGQPRASKEFGTFIPIGYPTEEQRKRGATGGDVGIHGPKRGFAWTGRMGTWINWTRGCIAVATDAAILEIAGWVRAQKSVAIHIE